MAKHDLIDLETGGRTAVDVGTRLLNMLDEAMAILHILNQNGSLTMKTIDRYSDLYELYNKSKREREQ